MLVGAILQVPDAVLGAMLGFFAGFFLYVGAAELLPEAHRRDRSRLVALATILGAVGVYVFSVAVGAIGVDAHYAISVPSRRCPLRGSLTRARARSTARGRLALDGSRPPGRATSR